MTYLIQKHLEPRESDVIQQMIIHQFIVRRHIKLTSTVFWKKKEWILEKGLI